MSLPLQPPLEKKCVYWTMPYSCRRGRDSVCKGADQGCVWHGLPVRPVQLPDHGILSRCVSPDPCRHHTTAAQRSGGTPVHIAERDTAFGLCRVHDATRPSVGRWNMHRSTARRAGAAGLPRTGRSLVRGNRSVPCGAGGRRVDEYRPLPADAGRLIVIAPVP
jgi:hypothetical protein